jgi:hypothetical protein
MSAPQSQPHSRYMFECHFENGDILTQTQEDVSLHTKGKNAFYDVIQRLDEVTVFGLFSDEVENIFAVDLRTGTFSVNGVEFQSQDPRITFDDAGKFRVIFFKRHAHTFDSANNEMSHDVAFYIGWQRTSGGVNHQSTIRVA